MTPGTIERADRSDLPAIARLVARVHAEVRARDPSLPVEFEDPLLVEKALDGSDGWVARSHDEIVAALCGSPDGRAIIVPAHAAAASDPRAFADVYATASADWVGRGCVVHAIVVRAADTALHEALVDLQFGRQQAHALHALGIAEPPAVPDDIEIRRASAADIDGVAALADVIARHQTEAPVFSVRPDAFYARLRDAHRREIEREGVAYWLAVRGTDAIGMVIARDAAPSAIVPKGSMELVVAATVEAERGRGVGRAMTAAVLAHARATGKRAVVADWRTTNLTSARFWPRRGFKPVAYRMTRVVDLTPAE